MTRLRVERLTADGGAAGERGKTEGRCSRRRRMVENRTDRTHRTNRTRRVGMGCSGGRWQDRARVTEAEGGLHEWSAWRRTGAARRARKDQGDARDVGGWLEDGPSEPSVPTGRAWVGMGRTGGPEGPSCPSRPSCPMSRPGPMPVRGKPLGGPTAAPGCETRADNGRPTADNGWGGWGRERGR